VRRLRGHDSFLLDVGVSVTEIVAEAAADIARDLLGLLRRTNEPDSLSAFDARRRRDVAALERMLDVPREQTLAASFLAQLDRYETVDRIAPLLEHEQPRVRGAAAQALGRLDGWRFRDPLRTMAEDDPSIAARSAAVAALAWIGDARDADVFERALERGVFMRGAAAEGLAAVGDVAALPKLKALQARDRRHPLYLLERSWYRSAIRRLEARKQRLEEKPQPPEDAAPFLRSDRRGGRDDPRARGPRGRRPRRSRLGADPESECAG
jgi:HEAT repeat protein